MVPQLKSTKVLIVGKGTGWEKAQEFLNKADWNIWVIPQSYRLLQSHLIDLVFEVHEPSLWRKKRNIIQEVNNIYRPPRLIVTHQVPRYTDNSYLLPIEDIQKLELPLINTFAWMLAYAIHRGCTEVALRGINLDYAHEAYLERDGLMYILGYIQALGIKLDIDNESGINIKTWNPS